MSEKMDEKNHGSCRDCDAWEERHEDDRCATCHYQRRDRLDLFAAAALTGLLMPEADHRIVSPEGICAEAWAYAHRMLDAGEEHAE